MEKVNRVTENHSCRVAVVMLLVLSDGAGTKCFKGSPAAPRPH